MEADFKIYNLKHALRVQIKNQKIIGSHIVENKNIANNHCSLVQAISESIYKGKMLSEKDFNTDHFSPFYKACFLEMLKVFPGKTITYGQLAQAIGKPGSARAVGSFCRKNPFCFLLPCHRILKSDGNIGSYSGLGGIQTKSFLLEFESRNFTNGRL